MATISTLCQPSIKNVDFFARSTQTYSCTNNNEAGQSSKTDAKDVAAQVEKGTLMERHAKSTIKSYLAEHARTELPCSQERAAYWPVT